MRTKTLRAAIAASIIAASAVFPSFADRTLNDGLAVYMPFDTSPTENVVVGSVVVPTASGSPTSVAGGIVGSNCLNIPSGSYVKLNNSNTGSLTFEDSNKSFTAIVWANFGGVSSDPLLWGNKNWGSGSNKGALLAVRSSTGVRFNAGTGSARIDKDFNGEGSGHWTFYAAVCSNGSFTFYQGKSDGTSSTQTASLSGFTLATGYPFYLGQDGTGTYGQKFSGKLDDFALWTRPLSTVAVKRIFEYGQLGASIGDLLSVETNSTVSAVMVASSLDGAEGTDPNGLYIVDNTRTFTSPASATVGGHVYTLTGYTLETFNTTTGAWDSDGEGVHAGASYVHTSSANDTDVRITWQWMDADEPTIAVWTGAANNNTFTDPANWSCTNTIGQATANAVPPDERTVKYILTADADWTSTNLTLAAGVTLDLNGHNLAVENITGSGTVVDLANDQSVILAPDGAIYQKIQYVQATQEGANNKSTAAINKIQYVDTGYNHTSNTVVDIRVEFQDVSYSDNYGYAVFYGCRHLGTSASTACQLGGWIHGSKFYYYDTAEHDGSAAKVNTIYDVHLDKGGASYANYADGTRAAGLGTGNGNGPNTWGTDYIFANNQVSNGGKYWPCKCKVYSCKVYEGSDLKRDFVPVVCLSGANAGKAGFWCTVTEAFYGNSGYGTLTVGPAKKSSTATSGSVTITVAEEETLSLANVAPIRGNIKVVKAGAGTLTVPTTGVYFTGGIDVSAGELAISGPVTSLEGSNLGNVTAASGTKVTIPATDGLKYGEAFTLNGSMLELACSGTAEPVTTYITDSVALNAGAKIRFDTTALQATQFLLSTDGFTLGEGVESAVSCAELSAPTDTTAEASGASGILVTVVTAPVTAVWTGAANNNVFNDPGNWSCTNVVGGALVDTLPDSHTVNYVLAVDADWSAATMTIPEGATLNMSGHRLKVTGLAGTGTITDAASGYLALEYLQGSGSQYIKTGYTMNNTSTADFKAQFQGAPANGYWYGIFGQRASGSDKAGACVFLYTTGGKTTFWKTLNGDANTSLAAAMDTDYTFHISKTGAASTVTGGSLDNAMLGTATTTACSGNAYIFNLNQGGSVWNSSYGARMRLYYLTFSENGTPVHDFVPARRLPDGVLGLYDKNNGAFLVNSGSGSFTGGNVKSDLALNPVAGGELEVYVPEGQTVTISTVNITGSVKLVKTGLGTLAMAKAQTYLNGTEVEAGTIKPSTSSIATPYGEVGSKISATAGGTVDFNGNANMNKYVYDFADGAKALNGGAAISSGAFTFTSFYTPVSTGSFTASLADGTTLDLTEWNGSWPISNVTAPAGATVTVKVDMDASAFRTLATSKDAETGKNNGKLLSFGGARPANTTFVPDADSANRCRFIEDENDDIILAFVQGLTILFR